MASKQAKAAKASKALSATQLWASKQAATRVNAAHLASVPTVRPSAAYKAGHALGAVNALPAATLPVGANTAPVGHAATSYAAHSGTYYAATVVGGSAPYVHTPRKCGTCSKAGHPQCVVPAHALRQRTQRYLPAVTTAAGAVVLRGGSIGKVGTLNAAHVRARQAGLMA